MLRPSFRPVTLSVLIVASALGADRASAARSLKLTADQVVRSALAHNLELAQRKLAPALSTAAERAARAVYDPALTLSSELQRSPGVVSSQRAGLSPTATTELGGGLGLRKTFSTTGTTVEARLDSGALLDAGRGGLDPAYQSGLSLSVRQPLLQGASKEANEAAETSARQARQAAERELSYQTQGVAADALEAFWQLHAAQSKLAVQRVATQSAASLLSVTDSLIAAGKLAASERSAALYAVQVQRRAEAAAKAAMASARDTLARLIGVVGPRSLETPEIVPVVTPQTAMPPQSLDELQRAALSSRGDYLALVEQVAQRRVELSAAQHALLPRLDLVGGVTMSGISGRSTDPSAPSDRPGYWSSFAPDGVGFSAGIVFELPLGNSAAKSKRELAELAVRRAQATVEAAAQALSLQLKLAWRAAQLAREQLALSADALAASEKKLAAELALFRSGKTSAHQLSVVQAETIAERLSREQALADFNIALVELRATAGSLLDEQDNA